MQNSRIELSESFLPPLEELLPALEQIWATRRLSNCGPFHQQFELALALYLGVGYVALCGNGSFALQAALDALDVSGEVITTPFSFVATAHALHLRGLRPVFADIDPLTLTLDPARVEKAITPATTAILAVHLFGHPCRHEELHSIAERHGIRLIYDAAHAFGVSDTGGSVLRYGDLSIASFHASKVFTTFEGGAVVCHSADMHRRIACYRNFGIIDGEAEGIGFNGKMNEFQAALGVLQLKHVSRVIEQRAKVVAHYQDCLASCAGLHVLQCGPGIKGNFSFLPVMFAADKAYMRDEVCRRLRDEGIMVRRYFYPLLSTLQPYRDLPSAAAANLPEAVCAAERILCLPVYPGLPLESVEYISARIGKILHGKS